jgi:hypothetical protein
MTTAIVCVVPAAGKDGVEATLTTKLPLDAKSGSQVKVGWTLAYLHDGRLFGAGGVFVRLVSASGGAAETAFASQDRGHYTATVVVPEGGIGDVEIGLRGWVSGNVDRRTSDLLFAITNDPVAGAARVASPARARPGSGQDESAQKTWLYAVIVASLLAIGVAFVVVARRTPRQPPAVRTGVRPREETVARRSRHRHERGVKRLLARL